MADDQMRSVLQIINWGAFLKKEISKIGLFLPRLQNLFSSKRRRKILQPCSFYYRPTKLAQSIIIRSSINNDSSTRSIDFVFSFVPTELLRTSYTVRYVRTLYGTDLYLLHVISRSSILKFRDDMHVRIHATTNCYRYKYSNKLRTQNVA